MACLYWLLEHLFQSWVQYQPGIKARQQSQASEVRQLEPQFEPISEAREEALMTAPVEEPVNQSEEPPTSSQALSRQPSEPSDPSSRAEVTVLLPRALVGRAGNRTSVSVTAGTVREMIDELEAAYPGLRFNLCHETGELRPFVNIFVNGAHVRYLGGIETPLPPGATLHILPSVAGG